MKIIPVTTRPMVPPRDDLYAVVDAHLPQLQEGDVVLISSKVVAIHQGRCVPVTDDVAKDDLIEHEAEQYIPRAVCPGKHVIMTIKHNTLIASAGIDESNAAGHYILWPRDIQSTCKSIWQYLRTRDTVTDLGVILTDSHSTPMRAGVLGIGIGFWGFEPIRDYRGKEDIFGKKLTIARTNIVDSLAATAVYVMGEGAECTPIVIIRGLDDIEFTQKNTYESFVIKPEDDVYHPLLSAFDEYS